MIENRKLQVFLCHSSQDKPFVRELYQRLKVAGWINPWLDEEELLPGQDWDMEIEKATRIADAVIICLSTNSVDKEGYVQYEIRLALKTAGYKPDNTIFIIPIRLDNCTVPTRLDLQHYVDFFPSEKKDWAYQRLIKSLRTRYEQIIQRESKEINTEKTEEKITGNKKREVVKKKKPNTTKEILENEKGNRQVASLNRNVFEISKHKDIEKHLAERDTLKKKPSLITKNRLRIGLLIGIFDPLAIALFDRASGIYIPNDLIYFVLLGLIIGAISAWQINLIEKNQSGSDGGKAGLIVNAISGISHQLFLPVFLGLISRSVNIDNFFYVLFEEGFSFTFIYLIPAMTAGYITGYLKAKPKSN